MENKLQEYIHDLLYLRKHKDEHALEALRQEAQKEFVTIAEAGDTIQEIVDDLADYVDLAQGVMEARLFAVINNLPEENKEKIIQEFKDVDDDFLTTIQTEGENDNE